MTPNIHPTQGFLLVQFVPKSGLSLYMPDGQRNPNNDIVVLAVGPDVPQNPPIKVGATVLLRGDAKIFGTDDKQQIACIDFHNVMAIVGDALMTDEEIDKLSSVLVKN